MGPASRRLWISRSSLARCCKNRMFIRPFSALRPAMNVPEQTAAWILFSIARAVGSRSQSRQNYQPRLPPKLRPTSFGMNCLWRLKIAGLSLHRKPFSCMVSDRLRKICRMAFGLKAISTKMQEFAQSCPGNAPATPHYSVNRYGKARGLHLFKLHRKLAHRHWPLYLRTKIVILPATGYVST